MSDTAEWGCCKMVKVEASVVIKAPKSEVYAWFSKPENWAKFEGAAWKSVRVTVKRGAVVTATQEGTVARKSMKGTFKYSCSAPDKVDAVWSGSYGRVAFKEQPFSWDLTEVPGGTKVSWSTVAYIPCFVKLFGPGGEAVLQGLMQKELEKIQKMFQK